MIESTTRTATTRSSSYLTSIYDNDYLELVWKNGKVVVQGGSSRSTQMNTPSRIGYSTNPSRGEKAYDRDAFIAKGANLSPLHGNSHQSSDQNSCQIDLLLSKSNNSCSYNNKLEDGCVISRPVRESKLATTENGCLYTSSKQQCLLPSDTFKKPRMDSSQTTKPSNSLVHDMGNVINFSTYKVKSATLPAINTASARVNEIKATNVAGAAAAFGAATTSSKATDGSAVIDSSRGSCALIRPQGKNPLVSDASNPPVSFAARSRGPFPCKQSAAVSHHNSALGAKRKADINFCNEPLLQSSSVCSLGASNNPDICSRKQAEIDVSTRISDNDEDAEDAVKETDAREGNRVKRTRNAETHNLSERKRRDKINKKMRVLKELIPNCNKVDKASMLDDAIEYLKTLQLQLQIMSMGTGLCMPLMMLPTAPHHMINTPNMPQLIGAGMGLRPGGGAGIPPCNLPRFSIPPMPAAGITDNRIRMFGFPNQLLPMPMSHHAPFIPMVGKLSSTQLPLQATCTATSNLAENLASAHQLTTLKVSAPSNSL